MRPLPTPSTAAYNHNPTSSRVQPQSHQQPRATTIPPAAAYNHNPTSSRVQPQSHQQPRATTIPPAAAGPSPRDPDRSPALRSPRKTPKGPAARRPPIPSAPQDPTPDVPPDNTAAGGITAPRSPAGDPADATAAPPSDRLPPAPKRAPPRPPRRRPCQDVHVKQNCRFHATQNAMPVKEKFSGSKGLRRIERVAPDETVAPSGTTPSGLGALVFVFRGLRPRLFILIPFGDRRRNPRRSGVMFPGR